MRNGGAACTAANRIYVSKKIAKDFTERLTDAMAKIKMAPGLSEGAQLGAFVSMKERNKIAELVDTAVKSGADVKTGGKIVTDKGAFYPPTVLEVDPRNEILKHEVFGPVAPIVTFDDDDLAIEMANDTEFGLISYVFSSNLRRAIRAAEAIESGMVAINRGVISDPAAPFGGVKQSGIGREGGFDGINEFLEKKYIGVEI
jgi:succinate-semialdehyde dehydrogenase/glutarate-semialdehyde dehydrogenase